MMVYIGIRVQYDNKDGDQGNVQVELIVRNDPRDLEICLQILDLTRSQLSFSQAIVHNSCPASSIVLSQNCQAITSKEFRGGERWSRYSEQA